MSMSYKHGNSKDPFAKQPGEPQLGRSLDAASHCFRKQAQEERAATKQVLTEMRQVG